MFLGLGPEAGDLGRRAWLQRRVTVEGVQQRFFRFGDRRPTGVRRRPDLGQHGPVERGHAISQRVGHPGQRDLRGLRAPQRLDRGVHVALCGLLAEQQHQGDRRETQPEPRGQAQAEERAESTGR